MTVTFYNVSAAPNELEKDLGEGTVINTCHPVEPCDYLNPSFIMDKSAATQSANYCQIGAPLKRYYFITDTQLLTGGRVLVSCAVDVLKTYADKIKNCIGTFTRSEYPVSRYIHDNKFPLTGDMGAEASLFPQTPFTLGDSTTHNYILTVVGGGNSGS